MTMNHTSPWRGPHFRLKWHESQSKIQTKMRPMSTKTVCLDYSMTRMIPMIPIPTLLIKVKEKDQVCQWTLPKVLMEGARFFVIWQPNFKPMSEKGQIMFGVRYYKRTPWYQK